MSVRAPSRQKTRETQEAKFEDVHDDLGHGWKTYVINEETGLPEIPITEWVTSEHLLDRPLLYPRQATILKIMFLQDSLFCADEQTEILTQRGWMRYDKVIEGEDVLALDPTSGLAEWVPADHINVFPVEDTPMVLMESGSHSSLTTPNHRWLSERMYASGGGRYKHGSYERRREFVETRHLGGNDSIPCAAEVVNLPEPKWSDAFVELAGWYWTEGTSCHHGGVTIGQSQRVNPEKAQRIRQCLDALYGPASEALEHFKSEPAWCESVESDRGMVYFRLNEQASLDLRWVIEGKDKVLAAWFVASLSSEQLHLFIDTSIAADGWVHRYSPTTRTITQKRRESLDVLQMACSLAGIRTVLREKLTRGTGKYAGRPHWALSLRGGRKRFSPQRKSFRIEERLHTGVVWCPTTKHGTWLARRNGTVYFTGNTDYDRHVIGEWTEKFKATADEHGYGNNGTQPDIYERIRINKEADRPWFRENVIVVGRRGSKGHLGALAGSYVLYTYMGMGDPQREFGIARDKRLSCLVFAGKKQQAKENQWRDLKNVITGGPVFSKYLARTLGESLTVHSPVTLAKARRMLDQGYPYDVAHDNPAFEIVPKESTVMSGRGPATPMQFYDEMAHVVNATARASAEEVYGSSTPALDTFGKYAFLYEPSSPWQQMGQFYENYQHSLELDHTGSPVYPEMFMLQLTSWDPYLDWELAGDPALHLHDNGPSFLKIMGPIQTYDEQMERLERANPETFSVERRSHWAASLNAYLNPTVISDIWKPWPNEHRPLVQQARGVLAVAYRAHGDPSKSGANFGFGIAHIEGPDERGLPHVVFDRVGAWLPADFPDHQIDYEYIDSEWELLLDAFMPAELTFDQFNSIQTIQRLNRHIRAQHYPKRVTVYERPATAPLNWKTFETFKTACGLRLVHAPYFELAEQELTFLEEEKGKVDHPTSGPVQTKDVADCMAIITYELIGSQISAFIGKTLAELPLGGGQPGGTRPFTAPTNQRDDVHERLSNFRARGHRTDRGGWGHRGRRGF